MTVSREVPLLSQRLHLGLATFDLVMRANHSLKDKRRIVRSVKERLSNRLGVCVAEVDGMDVHQRATLAVACVGSDRRNVERVLQQAQKIAEIREDAEVWNWTVEWR